MSEVQKCPEGNGSAVTAAQGQVSFSPLVGYDIDAEGLTLKDQDGNTIPLGKGNQAALCRCGQSENKPFCDGTHKDIGFSGLWNGLPVRIVMIGTLTGLQWMIYVCISTSFVSILD